MRDWASSEASPIPTCNERSECVLGLPGGASGVLHPGCFNLNHVRVVIGPTEAGSSST